MATPARHNMDSMRPPQQQQQQRSIVAQGFASSSTSGITASTATAGASVTTTTSGTSQLLGGNAFTLLMKIAFCKAKLFYIEILCNALCKTLN